MITTLLFVLLCGPAALGLVQDRAESGPEAPLVPEEARARLESLLPDAGAQGASRDGVMAAYGPATLYEYIDGAAEGFIAYDFVALGHAAYKKGDAEVTVDIYDMGQADNAFGVYSSERSPESDFINMGAEGYRSDSVLNFLQGRYYVKLSAFSEKQKTRQILEAFARDISRRIGVDLSLPKEIALFPRSGLKKHTETFIRQAPLGYEFLSPAYSAKYSFGGKEMTLLLSVGGAETDAMERVELLREQVSKSGEATSVEAPTAGFKGSSRYQGNIFAFPRGVYAVILVEPPEPPGPVINEIVAALDRSN